MNGTPRLRSAFPSTPHDKNKSPPPRSNETPSKSAFAPIGSRLPDIGSLLPPKPEPNAPLISFDIIDAPSQRLYVLGFWLLLLLWRLYDYYNLTVDETESLWQFMKWLAIDIASLYTLEAMRIPWLEFSPTTQLVLFFGHALLDGFLMFRIPLPFNAFLVALVRMLYDRELTISERYVKPADVIHNPSLILGRQIIHVLPEGSAVLNPDNLPLCLDSSKFSPSVALPLRINQTNPVSIELVRFDLETPENETITISAAHAKRLRKDAVKGLSINPSDPVTLRYPVKKTGLYRLHRVVDETKLEVQGASEALVVACPTARINYAGPNRCPGDLSDLSIEVTGTPPLQLKYRKTSEKGGEQALSYQSIQPDDFVSPLTRRQDVGTLTSKDSFDISWARSYVVKLPLNESLEAGRLIYSIEKVSDGSNNAVSYLPDEDSDRAKGKSSHTEARLLVHDRPTVSLKGSDMQRVERAPKGIYVDTTLAVTGKLPSANAEYSLTYKFTPVDKLSPSGDHSPDAKIKDVTLKPADPKPSLRVRDPGLYTLVSVSSQFCPGDVREPRSFMLINPPEPDLSIATEEISDRCAGNPIGYRVDLDLSGTPPFTVRFLEKSKTGEVIKELAVNGLRGHVELKPADAGHYSYKFIEISDAVYRRAISLQQKELVLEQDVKPSVSAELVDVRPVQLCIDETAQFKVRFQGEPPWSLEYELVHGGKRSKQAISGITDAVHAISTGPLTSGGEHALVLMSVIDKLGCKEALQQEAKISVRHQRPKVAFGSIEGKYTIRTLEGKSNELPLRLAGEQPWTVVYQHVDGESAETKTKIIKRPNDFIPAPTRGLYKLVSVKDSVCPGVVEHPADFEVSWIPRPEVSVAQSSLLEFKDGREVRAPVCEGEQDAVDILFNGRPPFEVKYKTLMALDSGAKPTKKDRDLKFFQNAGQIKMDTLHAGSYEYIVTELGDGFYSHESKRHRPLTISQRVYARPSASFASAGKVYSFCQSQEDDPDGETLESIPMSLVGQPPFTVDFELKRHGRTSARAEALTFSNIDSNQYNIRIPPRYLQAGHSALTIRRVRDGRGCERTYDALVPASAAASPASSSASGAHVPAPRVQISVFDLPTMTPAEDRTHYCVGERIAFSLSGGSAPYSIFYTFGGRERKAVESSQVFRRLAEAPGDFVITAISDASSTCKRSLQPAMAAELHKIIHALPSARVSAGKESRVDIHAGGEAEIQFDFGGVAPFEFTYVRRENAGDARYGGAGQVLETKTLASEDPAMSIKARDEGTYEVVAIRDRYCSFAREGYAGFSSGRLLKES